MVEMEKIEAVKFFSSFYGGEHRLPGDIKPTGLGWCIVHDRSMATFDGYDLTKLVVMAHDLCIRAEIMPLNRRSFKIVIWKRNGREGSMFDRHPTMEQATMTIRSLFKTKIEPA